MFQNKHVSDVVFGQASDYTVRHIHRSECLEWDYSFIPTTDTCLNFIPKPKEPNQDTIGFDDRKILPRTIHHPRWTTEYRTTSLYVD